MIISLYKYTNELKTIIMPKFPPNTGYSKKPAAGKYIAPDNAMAANVAAQQNVMPANTNQPPIMKKGPFKMNYKNSSFPFKSSPAKDDPHTTTETHTPHHEMTGTVNKKGTRVVNEKGNWVGVGDRPDLVKKDKDKE